MALVALETLQAPHLLKEAMAETVVARPVLILAAVVEQVPLEAMQQRLLAVMVVTELHLAFLVHLQLTLVAVAAVLI